MSVRDELGWLGADFAELVYVFNLHVFVVADGGSWRGGVDIAFPEGAEDEAGWDRGHHGAAVEYCGRIIRSRGTSVERVWVLMWVVVVRSLSSVGGGGGFGAAVVLRCWRWRLNRVVASPKLV